MMLDIRGYEAMAMLDLNEGEHKQLSERFAAVAESFALLDIVEADGSEPLVSVLGMSNVLREDVAEKRISRDEVLKNAPEQYDGYIQVPGTIE